MATVIKKKPTTPTTAKPTVPDWAKTKPDTIAQLLAQLSANIGTEAMPGAPIGAVVQQPYGSTEPAQMVTDPSQYGELGGGATFFTQTNRGGMVPISAAIPGLTPESWNPFKGSTTTTPPTTPPTTGGNGHSTPLPGYNGGAGNGTGGQGTGGQGTGTGGIVRPRFTPQAKQPQFGMIDFFKSLGLNPYRPDK